MRAAIQSAKGRGWTVFLTSTMAWGQAAPVDANPAREDAAGFELHLQSNLTTAATRVTLQEAVGRALAKNPTYDTAMLEIRRAEAVVRETKAAWLPTLYGNGSYTHLDGNRVNAGTIVESQNELGGNLTLTVPLVMTRQWMSTEESRLNADATAATSVDVRRTVAYATGQAYLAVYAEKVLIEIDEVARGTAKRHADYAHQRYAGGVGTSLDEVRAPQEVSTDDALVQQAYAQLAAVGRRGARHRRWSVGAARHRRGRHPRRATDPPGRPPRRRASHGRRRLGRTPQGCQQNRR
jgi:outer membrane protein TolC